MIMIKLWPFCTHAWRGRVEPSFLRAFCELAKLWSFCVHAWRDVLSQAFSVLRERDYAKVSIFVALSEAPLLLICELIILMTVGRWTPLFAALSEAPLLLTYKLLSEAPLLSLACSVSLRASLFVHMLGEDVLSQASSVLCEIENDCGEIMTFLFTCFAKLC